MSNTGVFAPPMGWCLHPIWGGAEKKIFATRTYHPLPLSYTPHFPNPRNIPAFHVLTSTQPKVVVPDTTNIASRFIAGCCHMANLVTWFHSHCPSTIYMYARSCTSLSVTVSRNVTLNGNKQRNKQTNIGDANSTSPAITGARLLSYTLNQIIS